MSKKALYISRALVSSLHSCRACKIRTDISAAAARVYVRHSILSGAAPDSSRAKNLWVSSIVLPLPADAVTQKLLCVSFKAGFCSSFGRGSSVLRLSLLFAAWDACDA